MAIEFTYFKGVAARGEPVRIALHASGVEWKDTSVSFDEFKAAKAAGKYGAGLPVMKLPSGLELGQSVAMVRYAGKLGKSGLYPSDPEAALLVDCVMDTCQDALTKCPQDPDVEVKKKKREEYAEGKLKSYMNDIDIILKAKGGPFILGKQISIADLVVKYFLVDMITSGNFDYVPKEYVDQWPQFAVHGQAVDDCDVVKAYKASVV